MSFLLPVQFAVYRAIASGEDMAANRANAILGAVYPLRSRPGDFHATLNLSSASKRRRNRPKPVKESSHTDSNSCDSVGGGCR